MRPTPLALGAIGLWASLATLGVRTIARADYVARLRALREVPPPRVPTPPMDANGRPGADVT